MLVLFARRSPDFDLMMLHISGESDCRVSICNSDQQLDYLDFFTSVPSGIFETLAPHPGLAKGYSSRIYTHCVTSSRLQNRCDLKNYPNSIVAWQQ